MVHEHAVEIRSARAGRTARGRTRCDPAANGGVGRKALWRVCRLRQLRVRSQKRRVACLVERTVRQRKHRLRRVFLGGREGGAVEFEKQDPDDEARALVAVDERVIPDDPEGVGGGEVDQVGVFSVSGQVLRRASAESSRPSSRPPAAPPCRISKRSWSAIAVIGSIQTPVGHFASASNVLR